MVISDCSAFRSIPVAKASQYLFAFTWEGQQYTWENDTPGFYLKSFLLLTNLKKLIYMIYFLQVPPYYNM